MLDLKYSNKLLKLALITLIACPNIGNAQVLDFDSEAIEQDFVYNLNQYANSYIGSELDAYSLNKISLWQTSGKVLQPFAVSLTVQNSVTLLKSAQVRFNFNDVAFSQNLNIENPSDPELPTVLGGSTEKNLVYSVKESRTGIEHKQSFSALSGINSPFNSIPSSSLILGVGLPANTQLYLRFFPTMTVYNVKHFEIGGGVKHQLSQYFLGEDSPFNISVCVQYNFSKYKHYLDRLLDGNDQHIVVKDNIIYGDLAASYDKKWFSLFILAGMYSSETQFNINGTYSFEVEETDPVVGVPIVKEAFSVKNPVSLTTKSINPRASFGIALKVVHVAELAFAYSIAEYNTVSANLTFKFNNKPKKEH
ncbi:MAG: hypothetical protein CL840_08900 [Crocinitomicaceae bacterium]|nr:hypothetical protein [Crocinitomicaceae bacterium]|tara:strand:- start:38897 stop:39988 length:1092 start_codon:yes stop_codon:yes gene_type:complete